MSWSNTLMLTGSIKANPKTKISIAVLMLLLSSCGSDMVKSAEKTDPVLVEYPVVFIERASDLSTDENTVLPPSFSARNPARFNPGAQLMMKKNAFADSPSTNLTAELFPHNQNDTETDATSLESAVDIRDLAVSNDGQQLLVSIRAPAIETADENDQPTWNIWRYQIATKQLQRIIINDNTAEQGDDLMASFLPDGRIIFASTRQRISRAILLDEGKPQYTARNERGGDAALNLHVMNADGTNIKQITFNLSHDFYPLVLHDGRILYSRWDAMGSNNKINLYIMNPDGTDNHLVYGWHSHQQTFDDNTESIEFIKPQQLANGDILLLLASNQPTTYQKRPVIININDFIDNQQTVYGGNVQGSAQQDLFADEVYDFKFSNLISNSGNLNYLYPLPDKSGRFLLSWDLCRVVVDGEVSACSQLSDEELAQDNVIPAPPWYELWLYKSEESTQQLVAKVAAGNMVSEAVVMQPSLLPSEYIADKTFTTGLDIELERQQAGVIHIRSVYDFDGVDTSEGLARLSDPSLTTADNLSARFLRVVRGVPMPPNDVRRVSNTDFGRSSSQLMREILGYTPIQPDGSVKVKIPANIPVALSVLDKYGQRIGGRHQQWITLKAGESLACHGCHERNSELPHGWLPAQAPSINDGASGGAPFPNANPNIIPQQGQTMAQADAMNHGLAQLSADIIYNDIWSNPTISMSNPSINYTYKALTTEKPTGSECFDNWSAYCRIQINYIEHIQPLWQLPRQKFDENTLELIADNTCTSCHSVVDDNNISRVPHGQLDLTASVSSDEPNHLTSYRELLFNDVEQEVIEGIVVDRLIIQLDENGNIVYQRDAEGDLLLDTEQNPIPVLMNVPVNAVLSPQGARASNNFFKLFRGGSHDGMLSVHELKLISEWLDIGGQYYNTPFYQGSE